MSRDDQNKLDLANGLPRRKFLGSAAVAGLATVGMAACTDKKGSGASGGASAAGGDSSSHASGSGTHLKPGELDSYYGLWSGGHTGDVRVLGLPSGREILRIPVFNPDALVGWGITNESKKIMGTK
ncbi:MAG: hypothetical protein RLZZ369_1066, partial [Pseudomonadota bacterium]